ncbi:MAG: Cys-tRNA(Pro) deacylase [Dehalococcoidia bacterium]
MAKGTSGRAMTPAVEAARAAGVPFEILEYEHDPAAEAYGVEAAEALHLDPAVVFKTLVAKLDGKTLAVGIVPVAARLDLKALAAALGARKAEMAPPAEAERATGYVLGGISPLGQKRPLPSVLDESAVLYDTIHVSAGRRGAEIALAPDDLVRLTGARVAEIARG